MKLFAKREEDRATVVDKPTSNLSTTRKTRSDAKTRIAPYFSNDEDTKLRLLSAACGMSKAELVRFIVTEVINNVDDVEAIQKRFAGRAPAAYAVRAVDIAGEIVYRLLYED